jgi:hypothetical protein
MSARIGVLVETGIRVVGARVRRESAESRCWRDEACLTFEIQRYLLAQKEALGSQVRAGLERELNESLGHQPPDRKIVRAIIPHCGGLRPQAHP